MLLKLRDKYASRKKDKRQSRVADEDDDGDDIIDLTEIHESPKKIDSTKENRKKSSTLEGARSEDELETSIPLSQIPMPMPPMPAEADSASLPMPPPLPPALAVS